MKVEQAIEELFARIGNGPAGQPKPIWGRRYKLPSREEKEGAAMWAVREAVYRARHEQRALVLRDVNAVVEMCAAKAATVEDFAARLTAHGYLVEHDVPSDAVLAKRTAPSVKTRVSRLVLRYGKAAVQEALSETPAIALLLAVSLFAAACSTPTHMMLGEYGCISQTGANMPEHLRSAIADTCRLEVGDLTCIADTTHDNPTCVAHLRITGVRSGCAFDYVFPSNSTNKFDAAILAAFDEYRAVGISTEILCHDSWQVANMRFLYQKDAK